jgi:hypothetical protein
MRPDKEECFDAQIWYPDWKCFCCCDSGTAQPKLAALVIPNYDHSRDKFPVCYRCDSGSVFAGREEYDHRFNRNICNELDKIEREVWVQFAKGKQHLYEQIRSLSTDMSMRSGDRTPESEMEAQRRHKEACNADPEKLTAAAKAYLGDEFMKDGAS